MIRISRRPDGSFEYSLFSQQLQQWENTWFGMSDEQASEAMKSQFIVIDGYKHVVRIHHGRKTNTDQGELFEGGAPNAD